MLQAVSRGASHNSVALIVGSAPSAIELSDQALSQHARVAVNNSWRVRPDFNYVLFADDLPEDRRPPPDYPGTQVSISREDQDPETGGLVFVGETMAFRAGYWACLKLRPRAVGFYALDMIYSGPRTHFYGSGKPDPLRKNISLRSLEAKSARLFAWAILRGVLLVNCSTGPKSRLIFPRCQLLDLPRYVGAADSAAWDGLRQAAREILDVERQAPFDPFWRNYWKYKKSREALRFIDEVDSLWLSTVPLIEAAWGNRPRLASRVLRYFATGIPPFARWPRKYPERRLAPGVGKANAGGSATS